MVYCKTPRKRRSRLSRKKMAEKRKAQDAELLEAVDVQIAKWHRRWKKCK